MHFFIDFIRKRIPSNWKQNSTGWISGNCPMCVENGEPRPDKKQRGGFLFENDSWRYNCFNCHYNAGWAPGENMSWRTKKLLKYFGCDEAEIQRASLELLREEETARLLNPIPTAQPLFKPNWPIIELPDGATDILSVDTDSNTNFVKGIGMLNDRKLLHWTDWYYTSQDFKFRRRMILPYRYQNKIVGYNSRFIGELPDSTTPKYLVKKPEHFVFNLDNQSSERNTLIVVEGDFDAISIDAVALGSNSLSDEQASLINQFGKRTVLLPDADKAGNGLIEPAIKQGWGVAFPEWMLEFKDANAATQRYGRSFVLQSTLAAIVDNPTKIRVLAKKFLKD